MTKKLDWPVWPKYDAEHEQAVVRVIRSNQLFAAQEVAAFEREFATYTDATYTVGVGNATQGLHLALAALGVGPGDEVIVTPYSWISSASCVLMQNAIPVFVDIEPQTFGLCPEALRKAITSRTKAVILVHMFGLAAQIDKIKEVCDSHRIAIVEDASHAHGARFYDKRLGTFGDIGVFSLHQRKAISTGDGGILCTDDPILQERLRKLRSFGADQLSYNYRMTEFSAALARVGLARLDRENNLRQRNHDILSSILQGSKFQVIEPIPRVEAVYYTNLLDNDLTTEQQNELIAAAQLHGIPLKRTWQPLHRHPHFSRDNMPNNVAPWDWVGSNGIEPAASSLPISELYQTSRLLELDCHPLVLPNMVKLAGEIILELIPK
jgi:perosamine synthetase